MTKTEPTTIPCPRCEGAGAIPNPVRVGGDLRILRKKAGVGLRELARELGLSPAFLHDLEHGRRNWKSNLSDLYKLAVKRITPKT